MTQSTVGRRLATLQARLGVRLLQKSVHGYIVTRAGETVIRHVERIELEAHALERAVSGWDARMGGPVRVSSSQLLTSHLLTPCFAAIHNRHQDILIEALKDPAEDPFGPQGVDIALRLRPFEHHEAMVRTIGLVAFGLYGGVKYLNRLGEPDLSADCDGHQLIVWAEERDLQTQSIWLAEHASRAQTVLKADDYETQHWAVCCGSGLGLLPCFRADAEAGLRRVKTRVPIPSNDIWMGVHRDNRNIPRIRVVLDAIAENVRLRALVLNPA